MNIRLVNLRMLSRTHQRDVKHFPALPGANADVHRYQIWLITYELGKTVLKIPLEIYGFEKFAESSQIIIGDLEIDCEMRPNLQ